MTPSTVKKISETAKQGIPLNVAVLGSSNKPDRYSYQAVKLLAEMGHTVFPVHPLLTTIDGTAVFKSLAEVPAPLHTVTLYLGPSRSAGMGPEILAAHPRRVIFNPGAENPELATQLASAGIEVTDACTLVLLRTGQFAG